MKPSELMKEFEESTGLLENYNKDDDDSKDDETSAKIKPTTKCIRLHNNN